MLLLVLLAACGGQGGEAVEAAAPSGETPRSATVAAANPTASSASPAEPRRLPLDAENAKRLVRDLIEAFKAGDRARVEALWARDGGTWTDDAGFAKRASYYQGMEFDLDPKTMETGDRSGALVVVVHARKAGAEWLWTYLVSEIGGELRAGGAEARLAGTP
jgi:hypothetical protein